MDDSCADFVPALNRIDPPQTVTSGEETDLLAPAPQKYFRILISYLTSVGSVDFMELGVREMCKRKP